MIEKPMVKDVQDIREVLQCSLQHAKVVAEKQMLGRAIDMLEFPEDSHDEYDEETREMLRKEDRRVFMEDLRDILLEVKRLL
jgi:hypothetical protein